jgi:histidine triad (HIT) family protein
MHLFSQMPWCRIQQRTFEQNFKFMKTLFEKIAAREIPAVIVYEDDFVIAFRDINPQAPTHVVIVPKKAIPRIAEAEADDQALLGHLMLKAAAVAEELGLAKTGYRLVINNGADGGETVPHLHCHIIGGRRMKWPPG